MQMQLKYREYRTNELHLYTFMFCLVYVAISFGAPLWLNAKPKNLRMWIFTFQLNVAANNFENSEWKYTMPTNAFPGHFISFFFSFYTYSNTWFTFLHFSVHHFSRWIYTYTWKKKLCRIRCDMVVCRLPLHQIT